MFGLVSYFQVIYKFIILSPLSVIVGILIGGIIGFLVKLPKTGKSIIGLFLLLCLSPKIGRNIYLMKTIDLNILLNALLFTTTLTILVIIIYRFFKLEQNPSSKENE